jgi:hypothetical protein
MGSGLRFRNRKALLPEPMPSVTRPGARVATLAMLWAMTGAGRRPATATPVPSRMRLVRSAASAR